jgi:hypothetical protein
MYFRDPRFERDVVNTLLDISVSDSEREWDNKNAKSKNLSDN